MKAMNFKKQHEINDFLNWYRILKSCNSHDLVVGLLIDAWLSHLHLLLTLLISLLES